MIHTDREVAVSNYVWMQAFKAYIYGRDVLHIETNHKPLEMIVLNPLDRAPKQLQ